MQRPDTPICEEELPSKDGPAGLRKPLVVLPRTTALAEGLLLVLEHHGCCAALRQVAFSQIVWYLNDRPTEEDWLKCAKHLLTFPMSTYLKNEPPSPPPGGAFRPSGRFRTWWRARQRVYCRKNTHLWMSWLQAKRACLPLTDDLVDSTYDSHFQRLSGPDPLEKDIEEDLGDPVISAILDLVASRVATEYRRKHPSGYLPHKYVPSSNASYNMLRARGGQRADLARGVGLVYDPFSRGELYAMLWRPWGRGVSGRVANAHLEVRGPYGSEEWKETSIGFTHTPNRDDDCSRAFADAQFRYLVASNSAHVTYRCPKVLPQAKIQAVLEPLKVRVISKGPALDYYQSKGVQKVMHSVLREIPCFELIGKPFCATMLRDVVQATPYPESKEWHSVDYSAATDGLSAKLGGFIIRAILQHLPPSVQDVAYRVFGMHGLVYPERSPVFNRSTGCWEKSCKREWVYRGAQNNGQLMGSPMSFPILCLANLITYVLTLRRTRDVGYRLAERECRSRRYHGKMPYFLENLLRRVLVNGDDMLYLGTRDQWEQHQEVGRGVGLAFSVGKAYRHPSYANVNSVSCHYDVRRPGETPYRVGFLNVGLFCGKHKVLSKTDGLRPDEDVAPPPIPDFISERSLSGALRDHRLRAEALGTTSLASVIDELMSGCLPGSQAKVLSSFLKRHKEEIQHECLAFVRVRRPPQGGQARYESRMSSFIRNLFLPISRGGMGVGRPPAYKTRVTRIQRLVAACCCDTDLQRSFGAGPPVGVPVTYFSPPSFPWDESTKERTVPVFKVTRGRTCRIPPHMPFFECGSGQTEILRISSGNDHISSSDLPSQSIPISESLEVLLGRSIQAQLAQSALVADPTDELVLFAQNVSSH